MGGAKRYPSMGGAEGDGFRSALPILRLPVTLPRHCERSEAILALQVERWIASLRSQ
jgi:hypothetical protein